MVEIEKKIILENEEYCFLKKTFFTGRPIVQTNYYYDSDSFEMNKLGITCRIRETDDDCVATVKEHHMHWEEYSVENSIGIANVSDDDIFRKMGLKKQGRLITIRYYYKPYDDIVFCLDQNIYLGVTDYELEVEFKKEVEKLACSELETISALLYVRKFTNNANTLLSRVNCSDNKSSRFFSRKMKLLKGEK